MDDTRFWLTALFSTKKWKKKIVAEKTGLTEADVTAIFVGDREPTDDESAAIRKVAQEAGITRDGLTTAQ